MRATSGWYSSREWPAGSAATAARQTDTRSLTSCTHPATASCEAAAWSSQVRSATLHACDTSAARCAGSERTPRLAAATAAPRTSLSGWSVNGRRSAASCGPRHCGHG